MKSKRRYRDADLIPDGGRIRVPMYAMDSVQSSVFQHSARIVDAAGNTEFNRPGYRILVGDDAGRQAVADARAAYLRDLQNSWHSPGFGGDPSITGQGEHGRRDQPGDICMINGFSGHLRMVNGKLQCVPDDACTDAKRGRRDEDDDDVVKRTSDARRNNGDEKECPACASTGIDDDGEPCPVCHGEGMVPADYEDDPDEIARNTQTGIEGLGARRTDSRSLAQMMRDHQDKMADIYDNLDRELRERWRQS